MNVVIWNEFVKTTDKETLFSDEPVIFSKETELPNLLKEIGVYKSTSQARKAGRCGRVPDGWSVIKASKKVELFIWNPME